MKQKKRSRGLARRDFVRSCAALMALSLHSRARAGQFKKKNPYQRTGLVDHHNRPFKVSGLAVGETYIFHYPYISTPCFLINFGQGVAAGDPLKTESGDKYEWPGGVGPQRSVVAFSAICAHKMTHPAKSVSFINYRPGQINYINSHHESTEGSQLIYCCSERSVYDPRDGARVLGGPARQPLAAIWHSWRESPAHRVSVARQPSAQELTHTAVPTPSSQVRPEEPQSSLATHSRQPLAPSSQPSMTSPSQRDAPLTQASVQAPQPAVSRVQAGEHLSWPGLNPSVAQVAPPRSLPSQVSPSSRSPLPHSVPAPPEAQPAV